MKKSSQPTTRTSLARAKSFISTVKIAAPVVAHATIRTSACLLSVRSTDSGIVAMSMLCGKKYKMNRTKYQNYTGKKERRRDGYIVLADSRPPERNTELKGNFT